MERAKDNLYGCLFKLFTQQQFEDKCKIAHNRVVWVQRCCRFFVMSKANKKWFDTVFRNEVKLGKVVK